MLDIVLRATPSPSLRSDTHERRHHSLHAVRVDEHEKALVMMRKSDRPERSERGDRNDRGGFGGGDRDRGAPRPDRGDRQDRAPRAEQEA